MDNIFYLVCIGIFVAVVTGQGYKPGQCPIDILQYNSTSQDCPNKTCDVDQDCAGETICCSNGCSTECVNPVSDVITDETPLRSVVACEGSTVQLSCGNDANIKIISAFWGRGRSDVCDGNVADPSNNVVCSAYYVFWDLSDRCDGRKDCSIHATTAYFGNPCNEDTTKYLRAVYTCESELYRAEMCEDSGKIPISCPDNKIIVPESVFYGRADNTTCFNASIEQPGPRCSEPNAFNIVNQYCAGRRQCDLEAQAAHFAYPCVNRTSYLRVAYSCAACENDYGDDPSCDLWALRGECVANRGWMSRKCRKSCSKCDDTPPACTNLHGDDDQCEKWALEGQCTSNTSMSYMMVYCRKSCTRCDALTDCSVDRYDRDYGRNSCPDWFANSQCNANLHYMFWDCTKSCFGCHTENVVRCKNKYFDELKCEEWAMDGQCSINPGFMIPNCFQACMGCTKDPKCENILSDDLCAYYDSNDQCKENPTYMYKWCWKTCIKCEGPVCENKHPSDAECENWALRGDCESNPVFMNQNCSKSCSRCGPVSEYAKDCMNTGASYDDCENWANNQDQCRINPNWMIPNCRRSCSLCDRPSLRLNFVGNPPMPGSVTNLTSSMSIITPARFTQEGFLTHFNVFFASADPVYLQIWTPSLTGGNQYYVTYSQRVVPRGVNYVQTVKVDGCVQVRYEDRVGFTSVTNRPSPVAQTKDDGLFANVLVRNAIVKLPFGDWLYPYKFSLSAAYVLPQYSNCGRQ